MPDTVTLIGYVASALVVTSLVMASVLRLRVINLLGATVFATYGVLIGSTPVMLTNGAIILIDVYHLARLWRDQARTVYFEVLEWPTRAPYLPRFLEFHAGDIRHSQPAFEGLSEDHVPFVILRDAVPVGVVLVRELGDGRAVVDLDYVTPAHRDFRAGQYVYSPEGPFAQRGIHEVVTRADTDLHRRYLARMGFEEHDGAWIRRIDTDRARSAAAA